MSLILDLKSKPGRDLLVGTCAKCGATVYESKFTLDDAYAVWWGKCPACGALNALDQSKGRGYWSQGMFLVLPTNEEVIMNDLPADCPTRGWDRPTNEGKTKDEIIKGYS